MNLRRKLLAIFTITVFLSVGAVAVIISGLARRAFEQANEERTSALIAQFRREFNRRGEDVVHRIDAIAGAESLLRMSAAAGRNAPDYGAYLNEARTLAEAQELDFLEILDTEGTIISSAQWPAKFGYRSNATSILQHAPTAAFLKQEELPDGDALGLFALRQIGGEKPLYVIGGRRLDKDFLGSLELPNGMRAFLYQNLGTGFSSQLLIDPSESLSSTDPIASLVQQVKLQRRETTALVHWSGNAAEDETMHAIPLTGSDNQLLAVLLVGSSRRPYVELRKHIRSAALLSAGGGMLLAILLSGWAAARVTRPVDELARAARDVAGGNWQTQVEVKSSDELGELAESFNRMTRELLEQKEKLVQAERVAAWRELARRLAHELKNPLFPLQLTVENLLRAREQSPQLFEETFKESSSTLLAEIANLKAIVSRFSEFSKMPQPHFQRVQVNEILQNVARLFQAQLQAPGRAEIECTVEIGESGEMAADPELLHRALSNLVMNAMDAMPNGGSLTLRSRPEGDRVLLEVCDTGSGLTPEECARLFTPYYTSKAYGTGLGLAIVQSVVSDHGGRVRVESKPGAGTTFIIELPKNLDKLEATAANGADAAQSGA